MRASLIAGSWPARKAGGCSAVCRTFVPKGLTRLLRAKGLPHQLKPIRPASGPPQQNLDFGP
ncbi:MAG: hypothetical protein J0L92_28390 [Deltaproteobacteria bacterium]|nr:hypothetical protein [Deltaproteobacteria bacterium]